MSSFTRFIIPALRLLAPIALVLLGVVVGWSLREMSLVEASYRREAEQRPVQPIQGPSAMHHPSFDCNSFRHYRRAPRHPNRQAVGSKRR